ncbi:MAG TPA: hypothetical protein VF315_06375, partial [Steroidobacteraceae bacterium]
VRGDRRRTYVSRLAVREPLLLPGHLALHHARRGLSQIGELRRDCDPIAAAQWLVGERRYAIAAPISVAYWYWNTGITFNAGRLQFAVEAIDTDHTAPAIFGDAMGGQRWVVSVIRRFETRP